MSSEPRVLVKNSAHRPFLPSPKAAYYAPCLSFACEAVHQYWPIPTILRGSKVQHAGGGHWGRDGQETGGGRKHDVLVRNALL